MAKLIGDAILILSACAIARVSCESDSEIVQALAWAYCIIVAVNVPPIGDYGLFERRNMKPILIGDAILILSACAATRLWC